jgi:predicted lipoprotein
MAKPAGSWISWAVLGALGTTLALQPLGCGGDDVPPADERFIADVLADVGPRVVEPALAAFLTEAEALVQATDAWATADADTRDTRRDAARAAFLDAMRAWQQVEVLQIGPLGSSLTAVAGDDGRDRIYSWDLVNPCRVDQETVRESWDEADFFEVTLVNTTGLDALEHLLWGEADNVCPGQVDINAEGTWDALGDDGIAHNRAAFGAAIAAQVRDDAAAQRDRWSGGFAADLATSGSATSSYERAIDGLNAVSDALFYVEITTRERKLGRPLGLHDCTEGCAARAEGVASGDSHRWIQANLDGFEALFTGGGGFGIDDLLRERGHGDVADRMLADLEAAHAAAAVIEAPIDQAVASQRDDVLALHAAIRALTDTLEGDMATVLALTLPAEAAGDAD